MSEDLAINLPARRAYAKVLRQFHAGRMTNHEYEDRFADIERDHGTDRATDAVYMANWCTYCDFRTHQMAGKDRLTGDDRRKIAQAVLMLRTGYDLPPETSAERIVRKRKAWMVLGLLAMILAGLVVAATLLPLWKFAIAVGLVWLCMWARVALQMLLRRLRRVRTVSESPFPDFWPFASKSDLDEAKSRRVYLAGSQT